MRESEGGREGEGGRERSGERRAAGAEGIRQTERSAGQKLTCSQSLNSSAEASSLSVWGRWIFCPLLEHRLPDTLCPGCPPLTAPFPVGWLTTGYWLE
ncbi:MULTISPECIES: hypothetical protein [Blautia]|uniref:hypothetical protein n=1 Tax=Blautia TaxID=572511 RepID=UPI0012DF9539|nr:MULTISPECIES: hypothetical protein [Blautia]